MALLAFSTEILLDGDLPHEEARRKWGDTAEEQLLTKRVKGEPLFLHKTDAENGKLILYYHQSYGSDWCDTMFEGEISEYEDGGCQLGGKITAAPAIRIFAGGIIALGFIISVVVFLLPIDSPLLIALGVMAAAGFIAATSLAADSRKIDAVNDYLHQFINKGGKTDKDSEDETEVEADDKRD